MSRQAKRYLVLPGRVTSPRDGDRHMIGARQLLTLYNVPIAECVVMVREDDWRCRTFESLADLIVLSPSVFGAYDAECRPTWRQLDDKTREKLWRDNVCPWPPPPVWGP